MPEAASPHPSHVAPAMHNQDRRAGYFELTEELLLQNKDNGKSSGKQGRYTCAPFLVRNIARLFSKLGFFSLLLSIDSGSRHLNLLAILKSLAVGLLLIGDSVAAGLLLQTILPYIKHIDSALYSVVSVLPPVHSPAASGGGDRKRNTAAALEEEESERQVWDLSSEQLDKLFVALV